MRNDQAQEGLSAVGKLDAVISLYRERLLILTNEKDRLSPQKSVLLAFWWKWYTEIQKNQRLTSKAFELWFVSLAYYLAFGKAQEILEILDTRDEINIEIAQGARISIEQRQELLRLDTQLKQHAARVKHHVNLGEYRTSFSTPPESWWWRLDEIIFPHKLDQWDWLWKLLTLSISTTGLGFLANCASRLFTGGIEPLAATAIIVPSILTLMQANTELTKTGQEGFEKLISKLHIPHYYREEAKLGLAVLLFISIFMFWYSLPNLANWYNQLGLEAYENGKFIKAERNYLRAISLDPDNLETNFNLAVLYEDLQELDKARSYYQIAAKGKLPEAHNNLARLYIRSKQYEQAVPLLQEGLHLVEKSSRNKLSTQYNLLKNFGWARFEQKRFNESSFYLQAAIGLTNQNGAADTINNLGSAHCLLAQVLEHQKEAGISKEWQQCCELGSTSNLDEDLWLNMAHKYFKGRKQC